MLTGPGALCSGREAIACSISSREKGAERVWSCSDEIEGSCIWSRKCAISSWDWAGTVERLYRLAKKELN